MLNRKRFLIIFIVSLVAIAATLYFKPRETWKVIELGRIHQSVINSFIFSPDGKIIATSNDREVTLWNLEAEKIRTLSDTTKAKIKSFVFSPDGQLIVTASNTGVTLWNTQGKQLWTSPFIAQDSYIPVVYFHPDGKMIVALSNKEVKLWNLNGEEIQTLHHKETIEAFRFSLDGQTIATLSRQEVKLWSRSGEELQILKRSGLTTLTVPGRVYPKGYVGSFEYVGFSPDGRTIITIDDGNVNLWSKEGKLLKNLSTLMAYTVAPNSNNTAILTWHPQGARLWNYQGKLLYFFEHLDMSYSQGISWSPDNQIVATAGSDGVTLWKAEDGKKIQALPTISLWHILISLPSLLDDIDNYSCEAVSFSSNGKIIAAICKFYSTGIFKHGLRLWSRDGQELWTPDENGYDSYVFSPDSQTLAVKHKGQLILLKLSVRKR